MFRRPAEESAADEEQGGFDPSRNSKKQIKACEQRASKKGKSVQEYLHAKEGTSMKNYNNRKHEWQLNGFLFKQENADQEEAEEKPGGTRGRLKAKLDAKKMERDAHDEDLDYQSLDEREAEETARKIAEELEMEAGGDAQKRKKRTRKQTKQKKDNPVGQVRPDGDDGSDGNAAEDANAELDQFSLTDSVMQREIDEANLGDIKKNTRSNHDRKQSRELHDTTPLHP